MRDGQHEGEVKHWRTEWGLRQVWLETRETRDCLGDSKRCCGRFPEITRHDEQVQKASSITSCTDKKSTPAHLLGRGRHHRQCDFKGHQTEGTSPTEEDRRTAAFSTVKTEGAVHV